MQPIVGHERETGVLAEVIGRVHERGAALVVRGEAGIGKSALLASASVRARSHGMLVLTTTGVQAESHLPSPGCISSCDHSWARLASCRIRSVMRS